MSLFNPTEPRFGAWLTTNSCCSWDEVMVVVSSDGAEADYVKRRKEDVIRRRESMTKQKVIKEINSDEEDLFFIKINKILSEGKGVDLGKDVEAKNLGDAEVSGGGRTWMEDKNKGNVKDLPIGNIEELREPWSSTGGMGKGGVVIHDALNNLEPKDLKDKLVNPLLMQKENTLAMVLYNGNIMKDVINGMDGLGLKRSADEEWGSVELKRRKIDVVELSPKSNISVYADSLRKVKARIRRNVRKKGRGEKENISTKEVKHNEEMEDSEAVSSVGSRFIFKVGSGTRKKVVSEGVGG